MLRKILDFWLQKINPRLVTLIATIGTIGLVSCLLTLLLLSWLFQEVLERESFAFDKSFLLALHQYANPRLDAVMLNFTKLGDPEIIILIAAISLVILWWKKYRQEAKIFALACLGAAILNTGLKLVFTKPRPQLWHPLITESSFSFPSGHALGSLVIYGFIAYLLARDYPKFSWVIYILAIDLIFVISFSRLYLGVHWLTDIMAGYGIGFLWLVICITMLKLQTMRQL